MADKTEMLYNVAQHIFSITIPTDLKSWKRIGWHYDPFMIKDRRPEFAIDISRGSIDTSVMQTYFKDKTDRPGQLTLDIYKDGENLVFEIMQPGNNRANGWLRIDPSFSRASVLIDEDNRQVHPGWHVASLTSAIMLAYMLATTASGTLMSHSASLIYRNRAYMFIGKSGTGKSTHTQLWLKNIEGTFHLNDDHAIVRVDGDGNVEVYGSPWSGKTDCYHSEHAQAGAIVRLRQAPFNEIRRLSPIESYASLSSSFSGMTWHPHLAEQRHKSLEALVKAVPCYILDCLPDDDAAKVCHNAITS